jgi:hypothetical protein
VRPEDPELAKILARQYIPVRLTSLKGVDLDTFRFDYDLTFSGLFMDGRDNHILARWGARDGESATSRLSVTGLKQALRNLAAAYAARKPGTISAKPGRTLLELYPTFAETKRAKEDCYHCHYAHDAMLAQSRADKTFRKAMLFLYPLPENIGITLEVDDNNKIRSVRPDSPAAKAGVRPGDRLLRAADTDIYTTTDLQWALNPISEPGKIALTLSRDGKKLPLVTLHLPTGWRRTDISWRPSQGTIPPILGIWEKPLTSDEKQKLGIAPDKMALRVSFLFPGEKWKPAQGDLKIGDVIVAVGGKELPAMTPRQFHTHVRLHYEVGGTIPLTILRGGQRLERQLPAMDIGME